MLVRRVCRRIHPRRMLAMCFRASRHSVTRVAFASLVVLCLLAVFVMYIGLATPARMTSLPGMSRPARDHDYLFETVTGFFSQDLDTTDPDTFDLLSSNFGLIERGPLRWKTFQAKISELNKIASPDVSYRVLYIARHGEGYHNVAEQTYGTTVWDDYWSKLDSDGTLTWGPDALLTSLGIKQASDLSAAWKLQAKAGIPLPRSFYTSPLSRAMDTLNTTWGDWILGMHGVNEPLVMENLRETIGVHTCDKRKSKTYIHDRYPTWTFESGFAEDDPVWTKDDRETAEAQQARAQQALLDIMNRDDSTYISITCHSGEITGLLAAIGHRPFSVGTGGLIPTVIKVTRRPAS